MDENMKKCIFMQVRLCQPTSGCGKAADKHTLMPSPLRLQLYAWLFFWQELQFWKSRCTQSPAVFFFLESNTCSKVLSRLTTSLTFLCCEKSQYVHDLSDHDCSQSNLPHISTHTSAKVFFLLFNSTITLFLLFIFVLPGKFPIFSFSFFLFLCAFHLYLTTLTLQNLFYPWLHGRRGKRKRKKDNERKKTLHWFPHLLSFCKLAFVELPGAAPVSPNAARVLFIRRGLKSN